MLSLGGETGSSLSILPPQPNILTTTRSTCQPLRPAVFTAALRRFDSPSPSAIVRYRQPFPYALLTSTDRLRLRRKTLDQKQLISSSSHFSLSAGPVALGSCDLHRPHTTHHLRPSIVASK